MAGISKREFYRSRGETYDIEDDEETVVRYRNAIAWMDVHDAVVVREVGCKFAVVRDMLSNRVPGADYVAIDIDQATLRRIPGYDPSRFICHDVAEGLPFASGSSDYILCLEVLEHLESPSAFLTEVERVLKPGGRLILSVPNPYSWMDWVPNLRKQPDAEGHISSFTYQNIDALLRFAGLTLVDTTGTYTRVPFSRRLLGRHRIARTSNVLLSRSMMYLIEKPSS